MNCGPLGQRKESRALPKSIHKTTKKGFLAKRAYTGEGVAVWSAISKISKLYRMTFVPPESAFGLCCLSPGGPLAPPPPLPRPRTPPPSPQAGP